MAHKASLEKIAQSAFRNDPAGTEVATSIVAVEALVETGIDVSTIVKNSSDDEVRRSMVGLSSIGAGGRLADALSTLDAIIDEEGLSLVAEDVPLHGAANKADLRAVSVNTMAQKEFGLRVSDMVSLVPQAIDALLVIYGPGGAKENAGVEAALEAIKAAL